MNKTCEKLSYVSHPNNLPLELKGNLTKKPIVLKAQDYKENHCSGNEDMRNLLRKKMSNSKHEYKDNKAVIPLSDTRQQSRPNSIRVFKEIKDEKQGSGVHYLISKTTDLKPTVHKERAHVTQGITPPLKNTEKKHFVSEVMKQTNTQVQLKKINKETTDLKLANDLYSNIYRIQKQQKIAKKINDKNLFKEGEILGFQNRREKKVSQSKIIQITGYQQIKAAKYVQKPRDRRQDWRVSNITFF